MLRQQRTPRTNCYNIVSDKVMCEICQQKDRQQKIRSLIYSSIRKQRDVFLFREQFQCASVRLIHDFVDHVQSIDLALRTSTQKSLSSSSNQFRVWSSHGGYSQLHSVKVLAIHCHLQKNRGVKIQTMSLLHFSTVMNRPQNHQFVKLQETLSQEVLKSFALSSLEVV